MRNKTYEYRNTRKNDVLLKLINTACYSEDGNFFRKTQKRHSPGSKQSNKQKHLQYSQTDIFLCCV